MKGSFLAAAIAGCVSLYPGSSDARGAGRFLGGLLARGAVAGISSSSGSSGAKSYTADTLTVAQLAQCLTTASKLDDSSSLLDGSRTALQSAKGDLDASESRVEAQRAALNRSSKSAVKNFNESADTHNRLVEGFRQKQAAFNATVQAHNLEADAYNAACAKKYYTDDLASARTMAGLN